jgi:hypothetical protein
MPALRIGLEKVLRIAEDTRTAFPDSHRTHSGCKETEA